MRGKTGQVLIETAIVLPLLILMLLGMIDFGHAMYVKNTLANAARAGARAAAVTQSPLNLPESAANLSAPTTDLQRLISNNLTSWVPADKVSCLVERIDSSGNPAAGTAQTGDQVKVTLTLQNLPMFLPYTPILRGVASMRYERGP